LSIIDIDSGQQPMSNEDRSIWIVSNSEIYNFIELRTELQSRGHIFRTKSDTEVILHLYEEAKEGCLDKLEGMFAFAIWDKRKQRLFLARDRIGIKPLHYYRDQRSFLFASEIKALLQHRAIDKSLNYAAIDQYFNFLYTVEPNTIFKNIHKLAPGHYLVCERSGTRIKKYWNVESPCAREFKEEYFAEKLREELKKSVLMTLRSDVPLGVFLSGGIDSSTITGLASQCSPRVKSFSVIFKERMYSEREYIQLAAKAFNTDHHELIVTVEDAVESIPKIASMLDEPFADSSCIPVYCLSRLAKAHVKTVLTGEGGDELFAGYPWHLHKLRQGPELSSRRSLEWRTVFDYQSRRELYSYDLNKKMRGESLKNLNINQDILKRLKGLDKLLYIDLRTYLPSDMLVKMDRMSMMNSLEARLPLLNRDFLNFCISIPPELKLKKGIRKYIMKMAFRKLLPRQIIKREKMGFSIPINIWLWQNGKFRDLVYDAIFNLKAKKRGLFNYKAIEGVFSKHEQIAPFQGHSIWALFMFELWQKNFLDN